jgi:uncharacterized membrane protein
MVIAARTASQVVVHMSVAFGIMYAFTGSLAFGGLAALLEPICVIGILPLHDRMWKRIEARLAARRLGGRAPAGT